MAEQRLLDLAKAQHLEFARLLEELNHEVLRLETPGSKLGATRTLQPVAWRAKKWSYEVN